MKKMTLFGTLALSAVILSSITITNNQSKRTVKHNGLGLSEMKISLNKAFAAAPSTDHQRIYDSAKKEVNTESKSVIEAVNLLISRAGITSCRGTRGIPEVSATPFFISSTSALYSEAVGGHAFPISSVTGVVFDKKIVLKDPTTNTSLGVLYVDCDTISAEVRYKGRLAGEDTELVIAFHQNASTGRQTILMFSDYDAAAGYNAAKMAVHYSEEASSQSITYAYAEASATGFRGSFTANTSGVVTDAVDGNVTSGAVVTDLQSMTGVSTGYTIAGIFAYSVAL